MKSLLRTQKLIGGTNNTIVGARNDWTQDNIVNSPYNDVRIPNLTLPEYIWQNLHKWADRTAVVCGITDRSLTYNQLHESSRNFAAILRTHFGVEDGDVVAIMMPNAIEYPIVVIGAMQAGAVVTTINPSYTANEVLKQLQLAEPKIIITSTENTSLIRETIHMTETKITIATIKPVTQNLPLISFEDFINNDQVDRNVLNLVTRKPDDTVLLLYSSGTTGLPKGVELTNKNKITNYAQQEVKGVFHCNETTSQHQDSIIAVLPFYHIYGLSIVLLHKLALGAKIVILPKFQPAIFLSTMRNYKINILYAAPPLAHFLGTHPDVKKEHLISVNRLVLGAAPISTSDIRQVLEKCQPDLKFINLYGLTEVSPIATSTVPESPDYTSVGFALPNSQLRVVDSNGRNLGPGEVGELHIRGPHVMKGYKNNPEATKAAITDDGWFKSGDLASINTAGVVKIVGRIKELIKVKGYQVPPVELEEILKEHPDILDAVVVGIPDDKKGEVPKAFIILKKGHITTATNIKDFVNKNVAEYKKITEVEFVDTLPKNPSGKILRRVLRDNNKK